MANLVRERLTETRFSSTSIATSILPTCASPVAASAFGKKAKDPTADAFSLEEIWERAGLATPKASPNFTSWVDCIPSFH